MNPVCSGIWALTLLSSCLIKRISNILKPIFHQNAKYLAWGAGVGQCPRRQNFALGIPTCWYLKCENLHYPTPNLKFALAPMPNPDASQWNIGCVGSQPECCCWPCIFHVFCVDFICVWYPTRTPFPVEYGFYNTLYFLFPPNSVVDM